MLVAASSTLPVPWKNGGGVTRELLRLPPAHTQDWSLRISVADIDADGPFSPFAGVTRWFAVLQGGGVRLSWPGQVREVRRGDAALRFDGGDPPGCALLDGPTRDLNVMVRQDRGAVEVEAATLDGEAWPRDCAGLGFFALRELTLHGVTDAPLAMPGLSLAWCDPPWRAARPWRLEERPDGDSDARQPAGYWIRLLSPTR